MIKIYGMETCPDCTYVEEQVKGDNQYEVIDIGQHVRDLKAFLRLRDYHPAFNEAKSVGAVGIPCFVLEDGKIEVSISNTQLAAKGTLLNDRLYEFIEKRNALELQIEELDRKEARMVLDGANLEDVHKELAKEGETLVEEMNNYVKQFIH